ncbi:MAG TPA: putative motility protein [Epulopiscium sp.]|nr:putative motility protein [Candidatus Epulonipiscium sp.]
MDIAALSKGLSQIQTVQQVGMSVMEMAMDTTQEHSLDLIQMIEANTKIMEQSVAPYLGGNIDIRL